jgi:hypothetical protein
MTAFSTTVDASSFLLGSRAAAASSSSASASSSSSSSYHLQQQSSTSTTTSSNLFLINSNTNKISRSFPAALNAASYTSLSHSLTGPTFLALSHNDVSGLGAVQLYDDQVAGCVASTATLNLPNGGAVALHESVFAIAQARPDSVHWGVFKLYDVRSFHNPFATLAVTVDSVAAKLVENGMVPDQALELADRSSEFRGTGGVTFDRKAMSMLVNARAGVVVVLDAYDGTVKDVYVDGTDSYEGSAVAEANSKRASQQGGGDVCGNNDGDRGVACWGDDDGTRVLVAGNGGVTRVGATVSVCKVGEGAGGTVRWKEGMHGCGIRGLAYSNVWGLGATVCQNVVLWQ